MSAGAAAAAATTMMIKIVPDPNPNHYWDAPDWACLLIYGFLILVGIAGLVSANMEDDKKDEKKKL